MPTLTQQRAYLAQMLDIYRTGLVADSGTNWISAPEFGSRNYHDGALDGAWLYIAGEDAAPLADDNEVLEHDSKNAKLIMSMNLGAGITAGTRYELFQRWSRAELDFALMTAIEDWRILHDIVVANDVRKVQLTGEAGQPGDGLVRPEQVQRIWLMNTAEEIDLAPRMYVDYELMEEGGILYLENREHLWNHLWYNTGRLRIEYSNRYPLLHDGVKPLDDSAFAGDLQNTALRAKAALYNRKLQTATGPTFQHVANLYRDTMEQLEQDRTPDRPRATTAQTTRWA